MMRVPGVSRLGWLGLATALGGSLLAAAAWAQSQPKFPTPLPVPKGTAPAAAPSAPPAPAPPTAQATPAPAAPAPPGAPGARSEPMVRAVEPGQERKNQEVANLRLVGVVWDVRDTEAIRALVETPDGLGYYLRLNEEKFGGKVVAMERDRVRFVVREEIPGTGTRERTVELRLPKPDGQ